MHITHVTCWHPLVNVVNPETSKHRFCSSATRTCPNSTASAAENASEGYRFVTVLQWHGGMW